MTAMITPMIHYPSGDGKSVAETFDLSEAESEQYRSQAEALQAQLNRYRDRFGEL